jgi:hypothetical protein
MPERAKLIADGNQQGFNWKSFAISAVANTVGGARRKDQRIPSAQSRRLG